MHRRTRAAAGGLAVVLMGFAVGCSTPTDARTAPEGGMSASASPPSPDGSSSQTATSAPTPSQTAAAPPTASVPPAAAPSPPPSSARFTGRIAPIDPALRRRLAGRNWRVGCPVPIADLRVLTVAYWGFDGAVHRGPLVVHERVATDVRWVFARLFRARFRIHRIALPARYRPSRPIDWLSTRNVTAAFNCRPATGNPGSLSQHSYGWAIDVNPLQNPYVRGDGTVLRRAAARYRDRSLDRRGMTHPGDVVVRSFAAIGWGWGGRWRSIKDYMHFSLTGR